MSKHTSVLLSRALCQARCWVCNECQLYVKQEGLVRYRVTFLQGPFKHAQSEGNTVKKKKKDLDDTTNGLIIFVITHR